MIIIFCDTITIKSCESYIKLQVVTNLGNFSKFSLFPTGNCVLLYYFIGFKSIGNMYVALVLFYFCNIDEMRN